MAEHGDDLVIGLAVIEQREVVVDALRSAGYRYVTLDLEGYRSGSMDESL